MYTKMKKAAKSSHPMLAAKIAFSASVKSVLFMSVNAPPAIKTAR
jgi:hypothetical protein